MNAKLTKCGAMYYISERVKISFRDNQTFPDC